MFKTTLSPVNAYYNNRIKTIGETVNILNSNTYILFFDIKFSNIGTYGIYAKINILKNSNNLNAKITTGLIVPNNISICKRNKLISPHNKAQHVLLNTIVLEDTNMIGTNYLFIQLNDISISIMIEDIYILGTSPITEIITTDKVINNRIARVIYTRGLFKMNSPTYIYREITMIEYRRDTFSTVFFPAGYVGFVIENKRVAFSLWDAYINDTTIIRNEIIALGHNMEVSRFDHEGNGDNIALTNYDLTMNNKYGFIIQSENFADDTLPTGTYSQISCYFIDHGPINNINIDAKWILIGTIKHHKQHIFTESNESIIRGFVEHFSFTDGLLYSRSIITGNSYASMDGITWESSYKEEFESTESIIIDGKVITNSNASIYDVSNGLLNVSVGGRINGDKIVSLDRPQQVAPYYLTNFLKHIN